MQRTEYLEGWELIIGAMIAHPLKRYLKAKELSALSLTSTKCCAAYQSTLDRLKLLQAAQHKDLKTVENIYKILETKYSDAWLLLLPVIEYALYSGDYTGGAEDDDNERIRINSYLYNRVLKLIPEEQLPTLCKEVTKYVKEGTQYGPLLSAYESLVAILNQYKSSMDLFDANAELLALPADKKFNQKVALAQSKLGNFGILWYANHMRDTNSTLDTTIISRDICVKDETQQISVFDANDLGKKYYLFHHQNHPHASIVSITGPMLMPGQIQSQIDGVELFISYQKLIIDVLLEELQNQTHPHQISPH